MAMEENIESLPYFHNSVHRVIIGRLLKRNGEFLLRRHFNEENEAKYEICVRWAGDVQWYDLERRQCEETQCYHISGGQCFPAIADMVEHYVTSGDRMTVDGARLVTPKPFQPWEVLGKGSETDMTPNSLLGQGNFGTIFLIVFGKAGKRNFEFASVKMVSSWDQLDAGKKEHYGIGLMKEATTMLDLMGHPNVVSIKGVYVDTVYPAFVMDLIRGENFFVSLRSKDGPTCMRAKLLGAKDAASAVAYVHAKGYIHRCVKASKFMVRAADGNMERCRLVLVGLGTARYIGQDDIYESSSSKATPLFWMAPETLIGRIWLKGSDVWSLGVLMWEIFTNGSPPYSEEGTITPQNLARRLKSGERLPIPDDVPTDVADLMQQCWKMDVFARPTAKEVIEVLNDAVTSSVCTH